MIVCKSSKWMVSHFHELFWHECSDHFCVQMNGCKSSKRMDSHFHELLWNVLLIFSYFQMNYGKSDTPSFSSLHDPFWVGYPAFQALKLPIYGRSKILFVAKFRIQVNLSDDETSLANELHKRSEVWRRKKIAICSQHAQLFKKWGILGPFFFFVFFIQLTENVTIYRIFLMNGFEPRTSIPTEWQPLLRFLLVDFCNYTGW